jgi:hypothetical protein
MRAELRTAGERVEVFCAHRWLSRVLAEGIVGQQAVAGDVPPDVRVRVEDTAAAFDTAGWEVLTRDAWRRPGQVIIRNACSSGLDLLVTATGPRLDVTARWRPPVTGRAASAVLRARSRLLIRAVLLQYPALWWSQQRGRVPLHASVCTIGPAGGPTALIAGPGGVGKSTLVNAELARGALATSDNVCVSDGQAAWGLLEPRRVPVGDHGVSDHGVSDHGGGRGRRMPHGRREAPWPSRVDKLAPDLVLVLRRGNAAAATVAPCPPDEAARFLIAGTYMAGELRRYWAFAAALALGTGLGETHPQVDRVARGLSTALPCHQVVLGDRPGTPLGSLLPASIRAEISG